MLRGKASNYYRVFLFAITTILYCIYFLSIDFINLNEGYKITSVLPLVYIITFYIFLWRPLCTKKTPFILVFTVITFIRYVVLSVATLNNGGYIGLSGVQPSSYNIALAGYLMIYELLITSLAINIWSNKIVKVNKLIESKGNSTIYLMFVVLTALLILLIPQSRQGISFFNFINYGENDEIRNNLILLIREFIQNAKYFLFVLVFILVGKHKRFRFHYKDFKSYSILLLISILIIGLRIGTNRKNMVADSLATLLILWNVFPRYRKNAIVVISIIGFLLVSITTVFRGMSDNPLVVFSDLLNLDFLQPYFLGQYNIAIGIEAGKVYSNYIDVRTYVYGFFRPVFGIGSLLKGSSFFMTKNIFDLRMSEGINGFRGDQILPMIGEGFILFGVIFSPIITLVVSRIGIYFDSLYSKSNKVEIIIISAIISFYLAQGMILNSTIILNMLSFRLAIYAPVVYIAYKVSTREKDKHANTTKVVLKYE